MENLRLLVNKTMRTRGRPKRAWMEAIKMNMLVLDLSEKMTPKRAE